MRARGFPIQNNSFVGRRKHGLRLPECGCDGLDQIIGVRQRFFIGHDAEIDMTGVGLNRDVQRQPMHDD